MDKKKVWFPVLAGVLALILLAGLFLKEDPAPPVQTGPAVQNQTIPMLPGQTTVPQETHSGYTDAAEPEQTTEPEQTGHGHTEPDRTEPEQTEPVQTDPPVRTMFPAELEDGMLTVRSLFQFSGMNPDADNAFGENIAGIELTNTSELHLLCAEVAVLLEDGTELTFLAEDVPPGGTVMAFSLENGTLEDVNSCVAVDATADFESADPLQTDLVQCTVDGIAITVRNVSGTDLTDLEVTCHGLLDGSFFGGSTYRYNVSTLPAGASTVIHAVDCFLGMAEVVRVDRGS